MEMLKTAVIDIITLVATSHALRSDRAKEEQALEGRLRRRLRRDIGRGAVAYIDALARTRHGAIDDELLDRCRSAAEQQMARALTHQALLAQLMASEEGCLDGLAAERQDLWRLAQLSIYLGQGMAALRCSTDTAAADSAGEVAARLRRRLRKALTVYARATLSTGGASGRTITRARLAALLSVGRRGAAEAERLADLEQAAHPSLSMLRLGVTKPLLSLRLDWERRVSATG